MLNKVDHIGIAVYSVDQVKILFSDLFDLSPSFEEEVSDQMVKIAGFKIGETNLEFLEPTSDNSPIAGFLNKRGEGIHHLSLGVNNIRAVLKTMKEKGIRLIDEEPRTGAEGKKIAFVHPKNLHGILLELSENETR